MDVQIALESAVLERDVAQRDAVVAKLRCAVGRARADAARGAPRCDDPAASIAEYSGRLKQLNAKIATGIDDMKAKAVEGSGDQKASPVLRTFANFTASVPVVGCWAPAPPVKSCAFVTFNSLQTCSTALQSLLGAQPFEMLVEPAPRPEDVYWPNVGMKHWRRQTSRLLTVVLTGALCILWTVPMTFVAVCAFLSLPLSFCVSVSLSLSLSVCVCVCVCVCLAQPDNATAFVLTVPDENQRKQAFLTAATS